MGTEPYEPIHIALVIKLALTHANRRQDLLSCYNAETLARMLAVLYSCVYLQRNLIDIEDDQRVFELADQVMGMLISTLDTSGEPF